MENKPALNLHEVDQKQMEEIRLAMLGARENREKLALLIRIRARRRIQGRAAAIRDRTGGLEVASRVDGAVLESVSKIAARGVAETVPAMGVRTAAVGQGADGATLLASGAGLGLVGVGVGAAVLGVREGLKEKNPVDKEVDKLVAEIDRALDSAERLGGRETVLKIIKDPRAADQAASGLQARYMKAGWDGARLNQVAEAGILTEARILEADRHGAEYQKSRHPMRSTPVQEGRRAGGLDR